MVILGPKLKIASFNLLGDGELVNVVAQELSKRLKDFRFDYLVGPEVKVVPLLHELSRLLKKDRYIVCRKQIHGYMTAPVSTGKKPQLVLNGLDAEILHGSKVVILDDVVSTFRTMKVVIELMNEVGAQVLARVAVLKQGEDPENEIDDLIFLGRLPLFRSG